MNKNSRFLSATLALALLAGCQSITSSQGADAPPAPAAPAETTPVTSSVPAEADGGSVRFRLGVYLCGDVYYSFYMDGISGSAYAKESGTGLAFTYNVEGDQVTFHMGSADDSVVATVTAVDEDTFDVRWEDGRQETMTYVYEVIPELGNYELSGNALTPEPLP